MTFSFPSDNVAVESEDSQRRAAARRRVVRILERRWSDEFRATHFPKRFVRQLVQHDFFQELVDQQMKSGGVCLPDLDQHPRFVENPDGTVDDQMIVELGADPSEYVCADCPEPVPAHTERCDACQKWRETGESP